jgi:hypothetical protein
MRGLYNPKDTKIEARDKEGRLIILDGFDGRCVFTRDYVVIPIQVQNTKVHNTLSLGALYTISMSFSNMNKQLETNKIELTNFKVEGDLTEGFSIEYTFGYKALNT